MTTKPAGRKNPNPPARKLKLDKKAIAALVAPQVGYSVAWDADAPGLGVRVMPSGRKVWFWQGRRAKVTIGRCSLVPPEQARKKARELAAEVELGGDPAARRREEKAARRAKAAKAPVRTLAMLWRHYSSRALMDRRPSTQTAYDQIWRRHLEPRLGVHEVASITGDDLKVLHREITRRSGRYAGNRALAVTSILMAQAVEAGWRLDNPAGKVTRNKEQGRQRYLTEEEIERLVAVLDARADLAAKAIEFLLLTGCRRGEALAARWADFDLRPRHAAWTKPSHTVKTDEEHHVPLLPEAAKLLAGLPTKAEPGPFTALPLSQLKRAWPVMRKEARLPDVRLHDLRHSFASILVSAGLSLPMIGRLLGHANPATTARYAHLDVKALRKAVRPVGRAVRRPANVHMRRKTR